MSQNTSSYVKNLPGAIALSLLCMLCVLLAGSLTSGIAQALFFPVGIFSAVSRLCRPDVSECQKALPHERPDHAGVQDYQLPFKLSQCFLGRSFAGFPFCRGMHGEQGKLAGVQPPDKRASGELVLLPLLYRNLQRSRGGGGIPRLYAESV